MGLSEEKNESFLAGQILTGLSTTNELIQNLSKEIQAHEVNLATIKVGLSNLDETVNSLSKILKEGGDGQGSVLSRMAVVDKVVETLDIAIEVIQADISDISETSIKTKSRLRSLEQELSNKAQLDTEISKNKFQIRITLLASVVAFIASIATAILASLLSS
jgi:chromosome segregation ATPase